MHKYADGLNQPSTKRGPAATHGPAATQKKQKLVDVRKVLSEKLLSWIWIFLLGGGGGVLEEVNIYLTQPKYYVSNTRSFVLDNLFAFRCAKKQF